MQNQKIFVHIDGDGQYTILGEHEGQFQVFYLDWREMEDTYKDDREIAWYARDTLVEAEKWPEWWKRGSDIESLCEIVEAEGLELPDWIRAHRDNKLLDTLRQLENL